MSLINRKDIAQPVLPQETVPVPSLNGEVVVQGLLLSDRLEFATNGHTKYSLVPEMLARCVRDAEGEPLFTEEQWQIFGAQHQREVFDLFAVAQRLSGMEGDEKKEEGPS